MTAAAQLPLHVPLAAYLHDHRFDGRAVLPGVEALDILARAARRFDPAVDVTRMRAVAFDKFLAIDPGASHLTASAELTRHADGSLTAVLATRTASKSGAMTRVKTHAAATFGGPIEAVPELPLDLAAAPEGACLSLAREQIYPELVAFGPGYRNLSVVHVARAGAVAEITAPDVPDAGPEGGRWARRSRSMRPCTPPASGASALRGSSRSRSGSTGAGSTCPPGRGRAIGPTCCRSKTRAVS